MHMYLLLSYMYMCTYILYNTGQMLAASWGKSEAYHHVVVKQSGCDCTTQTVSVKCAVNRI